METNKDILIKTVKEWVQYDNEIRSLQREVSKRREEKKKVSTTLMELMRNNEIECLDIKDGQICYTKKNVVKPVSKKYLLDVLSRYFDGDVAEATKLNEYILENREHKEREIITLKNREPTAPIITPT
jgi:GH15 family glucan-1,4-alpha-glucosidase